MKTIELNKYIDHTLLKADASQNEIEKLCTEAKEFNFASVCVNPCNVAMCSAILVDSGVKVCTVIGFPLGQNTTKVKIKETKIAIKSGADEIDMVLNISRLKAKDEYYVTREISKIAKLCHYHNVILKVIIETCLLTKEEKILACKCVSAAKADFIKTSTGFSTGGATVADVKLLKANVTPDVLVKASGGIKSKSDALKMIKAGADRLGTSHGVELVK